MFAPSCNLCQLGKGNSFVGVLCGADKGNCDTAKQHRRVATPRLRLY